MQRVAIVINTRYGQTEKIALWLKQRLIPFTNTVHIFKILEPQNSVKIDLNDYDLVLIGAPVYAQHFSKDLIHWAKTFSAVLNSKECAVFTVSGNAGDKRPEARAADDMMLGKFLTETSLQPEFAATFGGAISFTKYNFFMRWMMKRITAKANGVKDTSRDLELTNWNDVDDFVHAVLNREKNSPFSTNVRLKATKQATHSIVIESPAHMR